AMGQEDHRQPIVSWSDLAIGRRPRSGFRIRSSVGVRAFPAWDRGAEEAVAHHPYEPPRGDIFRRRGCGGRWMLQSREHGQLEGAFRVKPRKFGVLLALTVLVSGEAAEGRTGGGRHQGTPRITWRGPAGIDGKAAAMQPPRRRLPRYVPGEVIVQFRRRLSAGAQDRIASTVDGQVSH